MRRGSKFWASIVAVNLALAVASAFAAPSEIGTTADRLGYEYVGAHPLAPNCPHNIFCYRVLVPAVLEQIPFPEAVRWRAFAVTANAATGVLLAAVVVGVGAGGVGALIASILFQTSFGATFAVFDPFTPDPAVYLAGALITLAWLRNWPRLALVVGVVGVFAKETVALVLTAAALAAWLDRHNRASARPPDLTEVALAQESLRLTEVAVPRETPGPSGVASPPRNPDKSEIASSRDDRGPSGASPPRNPDRFGIASSRDDRGPSGASPPRNPDRFGIASSRGDRGPSGASPPRNPDRFGIGSSRDDRGPSGASPPRGTRAARPWLLAAGLTWLVLLVFHLAMDRLAGWSEAGSGSADLLGGAWLGRWFADATLSPSARLLYVFIPFGFGWLFAILGLKSAPTRLKYLALGALIVVPPLVYVQTAERALATASFVVVPLAAIFLARLPPAVGLAAAITNGLLTARVGLSPAWLPPLPYLLALAAIVAAVAILRGLTRAGSASTSAFPS